MKLIISIDAEEDNWGDFRPESAGLENIDEVPALQDLFESFGVKPTYLLTYPVASTERSASLFRRLYERGACDIGAHCHPWNTPPFEEETSKRNSMLRNLPPDLQRRKILALREAIRNGIGLTPTTFRTGRWGYSDEVARNLVDLGYTIDTSITPYTDWSEKHGPDYSTVSPKPFLWVDGSRARRNSRRSLLEVPATIDYVDTWAGMAGIASKAATQPGLTALGVPYVLNKLRIVQKIWLSPEVSTAEEMIRLAQTLEASGAEMLNMVFHTSTLTPGLTPFVRTNDDRERFIRNLKGFLAYARDAGMESIGLSEARLE